MSEAVEQRERAWSHQGTRVFRMAMQTFLDANPRKGEIDPPDHNNRQTRPAGRRPQRLMEKDLQMRVATDLPNSGWVALIVTAFGLCWSLSIDGGFQGFDDLHYLEAAQHWLQFGPYFPQDHWASRLPLVLSFTAGLAIWGPNSTALIVPSVIFYLIVVFCCWNLGRLICGPQKAISFILILRHAYGVPYSTSFYPEGLEAASALSMITLALYGMWEREGFVRDVMLVGAGVCGGLAVGS